MMKLKQPVGAAYTPKNMLVPEKISIYSPLGNYRYSSSRAYDYLGIGYWERLKRVIENVQFKILYSGGIYSSMSFVKPYPLSTECEVITLAFIEMFEQYANKIPSDYVKFTIGYTMKLPSLQNDITYTLDNRCMI